MSYLEPGDFPESVVEESLVGRTEELDLEQTRRERYGDLMVALEKKSVILFDNEYFARFGVGRGRNGRVADVLEELDRPSEDGRNPDIETLVRSEYYGEWKTTPAARFALFTDEDGYVPEKLQGNVSDFADDFLRDFRTRDQWREDVAELAGQYRESGFGPRESLNNAVEDVVKTYPLERKTTVTQSLDTMQIYEEIGI